MIEDWYDMKKRKMDSLWNKKDKKKEKNKIKKQKKMMKKKKREPLRQTTVDSGTLVLLCTQNHYCSKFEHTNIIGQFPKPDSDTRSNTLHGHNESVLQTGQEHTRLLGSVSQVLLLVCLIPCTPLIDVASSSQGSPDLGFTSKYKLATHSELSCTNREAGVFASSWGLPQEHLCAQQCTQGKNIIEKGHNL
ncbi:hypothetical protein K1719_020074 [Acacia pycnantha]|nr:hypothetical protein K1719_020074 [Acacia pycnantha]